MSVVAIVATLNGIVIQMIMSSRVLYGLGRQGQLASAFSKIDARTRTPLCAISMQRARVVQCREAKGALPSSPAVACSLTVAAIVWALVRNGAPDIAPHEFVAWGAMVVSSGVTSAYAASRFRTPHWWSGVVKLRGYKLDGKGQIGLDVLTWWLAMGGLPGSLVVQLAINKQRGLPVSFLLLTLWTAVCATVWVIAWMEPNRFTDP